MATNQQITNDEFMIYSNAFGDIARAGRRTTGPLNSAVESVILVDIGTYDIFANAVQSRNRLWNELRLLSDQVELTAQSTEPMDRSFNELSNNIKTFTGDTLDAYLEVQSLQVDSTYASISNFRGESISESNIAS